MDLDPARAMRCHEGYAAEIDQAWADVHSTLTGLPPPLDGLARRWLARAGNLPTGEFQHRVYFGSPLAPPLVYLPLWLRDRLWRDRPGGPPSREAAAGVVQATMWGYLYIRIQDDLLDESEPDRAFTLLGNACILEMERALRRWVGDAPGFREAFAAAWIEFTRFTLAEHEQLRSAAPYSLEDFESHCRKVAFARVPLLALSALAGRPELGADLDALVHALGIAYGMTNDAWGWPRDLANGHRTWLLARAGLEQGERGEEARAKVEVALHDRGLLVEVLEEAVQALGRAEPIARRLELAGFAPFAQERRAFLEETARRARLVRLQRALQGGEGAGR